MSEQTKYTEKRVAVLLWLKTLDEYNEDKFKGASFDEKYEVFYVEDNEEFTADEYDKAVAFWIEDGALQRDDVTGELMVTSRGKVLFTVFDSPVGEVARVVLSTLQDCVKFVKGHYPEILATIEGISNLKSILR